MFIYDAMITIMAALMTCIAPKMTTFAILRA
jgi:hypothetical protein